MPESPDQSPGEDYFNDLSQQPKNTADADRRGSQDDNGQIPKPKRVACVLCRKRKLKCDGLKPSCGTCTRLQHDCSYDEIRKKSGPKRGYVKALEARLAQVETLLKTQDDPSANGTVNGTSQTHANRQSGGIVPDFGNIPIGGNSVNMTPSAHQTTSQHDYTNPNAHGNMEVHGDTNGTPEEPFPWEMIGLGLDEPLPTQDVINELNQIYFDKVHPSLPMIHRPRYYAAMDLAPHMRPPVCLRYAMWCNAAAVSEKYDTLQEHFYHRARKYIQQDEMKGYGEGMITVSHCQTWALLATHEFKLMYFPRAWMSAGRACRMALMMGLHRLDGSGLDVKQSLPPARDWTEREERRRTFWMSFCVDRYSSIGTGWPMVVEERDILTAMPCDEDSFEFSKPCKTIGLPEALDLSGPPNLSGFSGVVLMACLFGRNLNHLHRPGPDDRDNDLDGEFWRRHRSMDNILLNTALSLPESLRLPSGLNNANVVFMNMNIHTSTICLHQAAIFKAEKNRMPARISAESKVRCITAAAEVASIMRQISHLDLSAMNPFISFCLYVAARVFVQYLKSRPKDGQVKSSLQFLLSAMHAIKRKNPLTESFLVQLDVDLEAAGLEDSISLRIQMYNKKAKPPSAAAAGGCPQEHLGMESQWLNELNTYDDSASGAHRDPNRTARSLGDMTMSMSQGQASTNNSNPFSSSTSTSTSTGGASTYNSNLPTRQRTPLSNGTPGAYRSPMEVFMDTSPDSSSSNPDNQTPASSAHLHHSSSHTSNTGYSPHQHGHLSSSRPPNNNDLDPSHLTAMFNPADAGSSAFTADFDMNTFPASIQNPHEQGFIWSRDADIDNGPVPGSGTGTGTTTGSSSATHGTMGGFPGSGIMDIMNGMSDADWNSVMETVAANGWGDVGVGMGIGMETQQNGRAM